MMCCRCRLRENLYFWNNFSIEAELYFANICDNSQTDLKLSSTKRLHQHQRIPAIQSLSPQITVHSKTNRRYRLVTKFFKFILIHTHSITVVSKNNFDKYWKTIPEWSKKKLVPYLECMLKQNGLLPPAFFPHSNFFKAF